MLTGLIHTPRPIRLAEGRSAVVHSFTQYERKGRLSIAGGSGVPVKDEVSSALPQTAGQEDPDRRSRRGLFLGELFIVLPRGLSR